MRYQLKLAACADFNQHTNSSVRRLTVISKEGRDTTLGFSQEDADLIRATERERLGALVDANVELARQLHADDFQLINPRGESLSKEQYLGGIASGQLNYLVWEPVSPIEVRGDGQAASIRYQSQLEIIVQGQKVSLQRYWHTDTYEKRDGRWQVVWSQATGIQ